MKEKREFDMLENADDRTVELLSGVPVLTDEEKKRMLAMSKKKLNKMNRENKMGVMPVNKLLISMSLPMMISMLVQALSSQVVYICFRSSLLSTCRRNRRNSICTEQKRQGQHKEGQHSR